MVICCPINNAERLNLLNMRRYCNPDKIGLLEGFFFVKCMTVNLATEITQIDKHEKKLSLIMCKP